MVYVVVGSGDGEISWGLLSHPTKRKPIVVHSVLVQVVQIQAHSVLMEYVDSGVLFIMQRVVSLKVQAGL